MIKELGGAHIFILVLSINQITFDSEGIPSLSLQNILGLLKEYEEQFSGSFWKHFCVVITSCGHDRAALKKRHR